MQKRCERNRKRSKRRAIFCPTHKCYLDSVSQKYPLSVINSDESWLEEFWCEQCQKSQWYRTQKKDYGYEISAVVK